MRTTITLPAIIGAVLIHASTSMAHTGGEQVLFIDGKIRTEGTSMDLVQVRVERDGQFVRAFSGTSGRMQMLLDLQWTYVLTFEREGCMSKALLFDTHVPFDGLDAAPFNFPFKVTLEVNKLGEEFRYAQPVGYIRYYRDKQDFDYDTNYALDRDPLVREQLSTRRVFNFSGAAPALVPIASAASPATTAVAGPAESITPETLVRDVAIEALGIREIRSPRSPLLNRNKSLIKGRAVEQIPVSFERVAFTREATTKIVADVPARTSRPVVTRVVRIPPPERVVLPDGRTEELVVDQNHILKIIRITKAGYTREYRRVTHRYGQVDHFCTGTSCSETSYMAATKE